MSGALLDYGSISVIQGMVDKERRKAIGGDNASRASVGPGNRSVFHVRPNSGGTPGPVMLGKMLGGSPGAWVEVGEVAVRALDGSTNLTPDKVYQGTFGGYETISSTVYAAYDVEAGSTAAASEYKIAGYYGAALPSNQTPIKFLESGSTLNLTGRPWGDDAYAAYYSAGFTGSTPPYGVNFCAMVKDASNYYLLPGNPIVTFAKYIGYYGNTNFVKCQYSTPIYGYFYASDHLQLLPTNGALKKVLLAPRPWPNFASAVLIDGAARKIGWTVINYQTTDPFLVGGQGAGVLSSSGGAFPAGMGGGFGTTPTSGVSGVE